MATIDLIINGTDYSEYCEYFKYSETINQIPYLECDLIDIQLSNTDAVYGNYSCLKSESTYIIPKLMIDKAEHESNDFLSTESHGWGESKLKNFLVGKGTSTGSEGRPLYDGIATPTWTADTIIDDQLALYTTTVLAGTIESTIPISIRSENDTLTSFFAGIADVLGVDWYYSYPADLSTTSINIGTKGTDKSGSIIFYTSGVNENCIQTSRAEDYDALKNVITCLGYGDGNNQLESISYHATSTRSSLSATITSTATTIGLVDASSFPASGNVWIGCEKVSYSGKSTNNLTGCTRGVDFQATVTKAYAHTKNSPVYDAQYTQTSPQSTGSKSSINLNGIRQAQYTNKTIIDQSTLDIIAEKICLASKGLGATFTAPERIIIEPEEVIYNLENISVGDYVSVTDSESGLSGSYRITKVILEFSQEGQYRLEYSCSNNPLMFSNEIFKDSEKGIKLSQYMQGATNVFTINETENAESAYSLFDNCSSLTGWTGSGYTVSSGHFLRGANGFADLYKTHTTTSVSNFNFSFNVNLQGAGGGNSNIVLKFLSSTTGRADGNGYRVDINVNDTVALLRFAAGTPTTIITGTYSIVAGTTYAVNISRYGGVIYFYISGTLIGSVSDNTYSSGSYIVVSLDCNNGWIDDIAFADSFVGAIDLLFEIPEDAVAINSVKLSYRNEAPRIWNNVTVSGGGSTTVSGGGSTSGSGGSSTPTSASGGGSHTHTVTIGSHTHGVGGLTIGGTFSSSAANPNIGFANDYKLADGAGHSYGNIGAFIATGSTSASGGSSTPTSSSTDIAHTHTVTIAAHTHTTPDHTHATPDHSHTNDYDISTKTYTTIDISIYTSNDTSGVATWTDRTAAIEAIEGTLVATENGSELGIDLTSFFSNTGWKGIKLCTNGNSRHKAQVTVKCYVQSKV